MHQHPQSLESIQKTVLEANELGSLLLHRAHSVPLLSLLSSLLSQKTGVELSDGPAADSTHDPTDRLDRLDSWAELRDAPVPDKSISIDSPNAVSVSDELVA